MSFEFEALVGHLYVVGGRAIKTTPPGALVEVAPHKAARGREADTVFTLVIPSGHNIAPAKFYEQMAQLAVERYFNSTGSVTSGLRDVFTTLNDNLYEHNQSGKTQYEAHLMCAVLRGKDLIVGRVGACMLVIATDGKIQTFPEDLNDDESLYTAPVGVHPVPNVRMAQYRITEGARMVIADAAVADFEMDHIVHALGAADLGMTVVAFKELARLQLTMLAVQFVPPDADEVAELPVGQSSTEVTAALRGAQKTEVKEEDIAAPFKNRKRKPRGEEIQYQAKRGLSASAFGLAGALRLVSRVIDRFFPPPKEGEKNALATPLGAGAVVLVPVAVVVMVMMLWLSGTGESEFELCVEELVSRAQTARAIPSSERETTLNGWELTLQQVDDCRQLRQDDPTVNAIQREGQDVIDGLNQIDRREVIVIDSFVAARLTRIVSQGQDLYVLDEANNIIYRVQLTGDGRGASAQGQPIVQAGRTVNGRLVGEFVDIAFSENANRIVALDRNGVLVSCTPQFNECAAQQLLGTELWANPSAITFWNGRLYVLDNRTGASQIWRYEPSGNIYPNQPSEVFSGQNVISNAVDFTIDGTGSIYVLIADGTVAKFFNAAPLQFGFSGFPQGQTMTTIASMHLDDSPTAQRLYFVNQPGRTIHETTLSGVFNTSYRSFNEDLFALAEDVTTISTNDIVYVVSGNSILAFNRE